MITALSMISRVVGAAPATESVECCHDLRKTDGSWQKDDGWAMALRER
jgi:hypothetical protein